MNLKQRVLALEAQASAAEPSGGLDAMDDATLAIYTGNCETVCIAVGLRKADDRQVSEMESFGSRLIAGIEALERRGLGGVETMDDAALATRIRAFDAIDKILAPTTNERSISNE